MLAKKKRVFVIKNIEDFIKQVEQGEHNDLKIIIDKWIKNKAKELDISLQELIENLENEIDDYEVEDILNKADNQWVVHYDLESNNIHLIEI